MNNRNMTEQESTLLQLPTVALRGLTVMPGETVHFDIGRSKSYQSVKLAMRENKRFFIVGQRDPEEDDPDRSGLFDVGVYAEIIRMVKLPDQNCHLLVQGTQRAKILQLQDNGVYLSAGIELLEDEFFDDDPGYVEALKQLVYNDYLQLLHFYPKLSAQESTGSLRHQTPTVLADSITGIIPFYFEDKQQVLSELNPVRRLELVRDLLEKQYQMCLLENKIGERTRAFIDESQREYFLREQIRAINTELYGEGNDPDEEINRYYEKIKALNPPKETAQLLRSEVKKLAGMPMGAHESAVIRTYLDTCLSLPFGVKSKINTNLKSAAAKLDKEHYGLEKVKKRILETLAVLSLKPEAKGHIICLVGPPGVGKTSIARSLAECMGRQFERISLGGIADESEIRGHRKTYLGSMPGKIIKAVIHAKTVNPLILLDEIDKLGHDYKGDPASALLEVLDAEQNNTFTDHYIDFPFDISEVMFLTTANNIGQIPAPLLDRMDVIELSGYTREDKCCIAAKHLFRKQLLKNGLTPKNLSVQRKVFADIADYYTREAGVRGMERCIAAICRKAAYRIATGETEKITVTSANFADYLGPRKFTGDQLLKKNAVGTVNGLAWTAVGGELMQLEAAVLSGTGSVELTGSLGDVMKESAVTAVSWVRANADLFHIDPDFYKNSDIHIHATEAAVPKDGPSAGVTMTTAIVSALTKIPVNRQIAMTGEITLLGRVLPIGGLKEKSMAAYRAGVKTVLIPEQNLPDLADVDPVVKEHITFIPVSRIEQVLTHALEKLPTAGKEFSVKKSCLTNRKNTNAQRVSL